MPQAVAAQFDARIPDPRTSVSAGSSRTDDTETFGDALEKATARTRDDSSTERSERPAPAEHAKRPHRTKGGERSSAKKGGKVEPDDEKTGAGSATDANAPAPAPPPAEDSEQDPTEPDKEPKKKSDDDPHPDQPALAALAPVPQPGTSAAQVAGRPPDAADPKTRPDARQVQSNLTGKTAAPKQDGPTDPRAQKVVSPDPAAGSTDAKDSKPADPADDMPSPPANDGRTAKKELAIQPKAAGNGNANQPANAAAGAAAVAGIPVPDPASSDGASATPVVDPAAPRSRASSKLLDDSTLGAPLQLPPHGPAGGGAAVAKSAAAQLPPAPPEVQFAEANHGQIISGIRGRLLPDGGAMNIRLDPPELGALHVHVEIREGVVTASFEAANDQTAKLLSHSLGDLKSALEAQGVNVQKLHVSHSPRQQSSSSGDGQDPKRDHLSEQGARQEQQRKDMLRRMWRKLMKGQDPLDLVA